MPKILGRQRQFGCKLAQQVFLALTLCLALLQARAQVLQINLQHGLKTRLKIKGCHSFVALLLCTVPLLLQTGQIKRSVLACESNAHMQHLSK